MIVSTKNSAGAVGIGPTLTVLETVVLPLDEAPSPTLVSESIIAKLPKKSKYSLNATPP